MALDEDIRAHLESLAGVPTPSQQQLSIQQIRQATHAFWQDGPPPGRTADSRDLTILGRAGNELRLRLYRPPGSDGPLPLVLFMHGGGFVFGSIDTHDEICHRLSLDSGAAVLSVDYRLAPEHPFPLAVHDAVDALEWVVSDPQGLGVAVDQLYVAGDSAGANLAAVAAQVALDSGWPLAGQALVYPVTDLRDGAYESRESRASGFGLSEEDMRWYRQNYLADSAQAGNPLASPIARHDLSGLPPTFIMTAGYDPLCSEGQAYASKLQADGVEVEHLHLAGANHGVFSNWRLFAAGEATWSALLAWLSRRFGTG